MPRPRVLSFMSQWGGGGSPKSPTAANKQTSPPQSPIPRSESPTEYNAPGYASDSFVDSPSRESPRPPRAESGDKRHSRRTSMIMAYQPPVMEIAKDTPPELQPIFTHLNSHTNKLYQEGYFLKLHDLDSRGRPSADRVWTECFAQLVGTVLSLWDAAQLDAAGDDGEVMPTFINMTDASIKMIESLPMNGLDGQSLQNVLSISTAANNRYLLHFNSLHSLTQWTAGIRLAMFEQAALQEAYTGSIIAGKGKHLNGIRGIMERARFPTEDWARVRFGAGTPWRRCWCVITPPDEKNVQKAQKEAKKRSAYEKPRSVKGDIKFYETKKVTKKTKPIATINNAYAAYAIYPQSRPLIDQSTLVKVEGTITIHSSPETTTEGFVFVMPEVHPAITGFEMMLRWLMPAFDTFALYGRPNKLVADVMDSRSLMFGMPTGHRYGYLDLIDVAGLIHTEGSHDWSEREWRKQMKQLTSKRIAGGGQSANRTMSQDAYASRSATNLPASQSRSSLNLPSQAGSNVRFVGASTRSQPSTRHGSPARSGDFSQQHRNVSDPALAQQGLRQHQRAASDAYRPTTSSRLSSEQTRREASPPPPPPPHQEAPNPPSHQAPPQPPQQGPSPPQHSESQYQPPPNTSYLSRDEFPQAAGYQDDYVRSETPPDQNGYNDTNGYTHGPPPSAAPGRSEPLRPVAAPPVMSHKSNAHPPRRPAQMPDLRRANSTIDDATLAQIRAANPAGGMSHGQRPPNGQYTPYPGAANGDNNMYQQQYPPYQQQAPYQQQSPYHQQPYYPQQQPPYQQQQQSMSSGMGGRRMGPPPAGLGGSPGGSTLNLPERRLPTIPGTPAVEQEDFDLTPEQPPPPPHRERSSNSIHRKPVPGRS